MSIVLRRFSHVLRLGVLLEFVRIMLFGANGPGPARCRAFSSISTGQSGCLELSRHPAPTGTDLTGLSLQVAQQVAARRVARGRLAPQQPEAGGLPTNLITATAQSAAIMTTLNSTPRRTTGM